MTKPAPKESEPWQGHADPAVQAKIAALESDNERLRKSLACADKWFIENALEVNKLREALAEAQAALRRLVELSEPMANRPVCEFCGATPDYENVVPAPFPIHAEGCAWKRAEAESASLPAAPKEE